MHVAGLQAMVSDCIWSRDVQNHITVRSDCPAHMRNVGLVHVLLWAAGDLGRFAPVVFCTHLCRQIARQMYPGGMLILMRLPKQHHAAA